MRSVALLGNLDAVVNINVPKSHTLRQPNLPLEVNRFPESAVSVATGSNFPVERCSAKSVDVTGLSREDCSFEIRVDEAKGSLSEHVSLSRLLGLNGKESASKSASLAA